MKRPKRLLYRPPLDDRRALARRRRAGAILGVGVAVGSALLVGLVVSGVTVGGALVAVAVGAVGIPVATIGTWWLTPHAVAVNERRPFGMTVVLAMITTAGGVGIVAMGWLLTIAFGSVLRSSDPIHDLLGAIAIFVIGALATGIPAFVVLLIPSFVWAVLVRRLLGPGSIGA